MNISILGSWIAILLARHRLSAMDTIIVLAASHRDVQLTATLADCVDNRTTRLSSIVRRRPTTGG
jgi:hypothetical protein